MPPSTWFRDALSATLGYFDNTFVCDLEDPAEQGFVAKKVEQLMRAFQSKMDFKGAISAPESG
ncbi:hypothetical protein IHQ71_30530 (plasmid) [Rhizobium sp. TH2]|uniref:hypothetical protein n=1 Tax=Rhizobium sp. TH2 TaxID=2775403 RepID=UPI002157B187|nr:hypothetical protein [Rhizobium sp. TH2]UVC12353.1 hypothetical protein IHQ71_30530 [Rhizobium sp. TH2]